ncbi:MAG TPA: hypothetical protein DCZ97_10955 [Syntrophus sp. (in: bacteria)]|nr:MAG: hypothetical protein A2X92_02640 [Syntrophus sp. GWC2_56_31]HBB17475.1 hypothetical protein [Syntrophus sp. (in: bacteria)]
MSRKLYGIKSISLKGEKREMKMKNHTLILFPKVEFGCPKTFFGIYKKPFIPTEMVPEFLQEIRNQK